MPLSEGCLISGCALVKLDCICFKCLSIGPRTPGGPRTCAPPLEKKRKKKRREGKEREKETRRERKKKKKKRKKERQMGRKKN